jgi:tetratricopeptide (TPR) repeat protein
MAFNKTKALESAQKLLNKGQIPQAIAEYLQILRHEPNDQVTLMTVGDLYVRSGDTHQALEYFEKLAQLFLNDGFNTKGIAIYKKIAKLAPEETRPLERLAELYVQQGVMSEARPLYLQIAEAQLKGGRHREAIEVLHKLVALEPDNLRVQVRLAELYQTIGQEKEAAATYLNCAQRMFDRNDFLEAQKFADRALDIERNNPAAVTLKARALASAGKPSDGVKVLEGLPEAAVSVETTGLLVELYLQTGQASRAVAVAKKAFERGPEQYAVVFEVGVALLDGEPDAAMALLGEIREAMSNAGEYDRLAQALTSLTERLPGRLEPHEWLVETYRRSNDSFHLPEALEQLGNAAVAAGQLDRAKAVFEELLECDPENESHRRSLDQVRAKLGLSPAEAAAPPPKVEVPAEAPVPFPAEVEAVVAEPVAEPRLDEETQRYIGQALTDADLFSSYGLTQKGIDLLEGVLQRAPRHAATLEKLLDLHLGAGNVRRTAELAAQLQQIHQQRGDVASAERFGEMSRRFQRAAGAAAEEIAAPPAAPPAEFKIPTVEAEAVPLVESQPAAVPEVEAQPEGEPAVHEVDLSEEWADLSQLAAEPAAPPAPAAPSAVPAPSGAGEEAVEEVELSVKGEEPPPPAVEPAPAQPAAEVEAVEYELELAPAAAPAPAAPQPAMSSDQFISELAEELGEIEAGPGFTGAGPAAPAPAAAPPTAARPGSPARPGAVPVPAGPPGRAGEGESVEQLREVFDEFRAELGEMGEEAEDLETHYNLGIAYREMGLLEEAIGEFQKVAKTLQSGRSFRYAMQCLTLLGLSFMDKGQPKIAAIWYARALEIPGLDQESLMALRYDLGVAQESAGDSSAALESFSQVYAMNIDYRDVAERIASLSHKTGQR